MRLMKTVKNAGQKSVMDVTDRNLGTGENRDRNQIMAGGQNQKRGQSRDVAAVIGAMKKNGEKETRR